MYVVWKRKRTVFSDEEEVDEEAEDDDDDDACPSPPGVADALHSSVSCLHRRLGHKLASSSAHAACTRLLFALLQASTSRGFVAHFPREVNVLPHAAAAASVVITALGIFFLFEAPYTTWLAQQGVGARPEVEHVVVGLACKFVETRRTMTTSDNSTAECGASPRSYLSKSNLSERCSFSRRSRFRNETKRDETKALQQVQSTGTHSENTENTSRTGAARKHEAGTTQEHKSKQMQMKMKMTPTSSLVRGRFGDVEPPRLRSPTRATPVGRGPLKTVVPAPGPGAVPRSVSVRRRNERELRRRDNRDPSFPTRYPGRGNLTSPAIRANRPPTPNQYSTGVPSTTILLPKDYF